MKLNLYSAKKYWGTHALSLAGWIMALFFCWFLSPGEIKGNPGVPFFIIFFDLPFLFCLICFVVSAYLYDWIFKYRVKSDFLLKNPLYDLIMDFGFSLLLIPLIWFNIYWSSKKQALAIVLSLFLILRLLKMRVKNEN